MSAEPRAVPCSAVPRAVRAIRGATTLDADTREDVFARVTELLRVIVAENEVAHDDLISMIFTATPDIRSCFPATAARELGFDDVPLLGAQELDVDGALPLCVRVMMHVESDRSRADIRHAYLHGAVALRRDLSR